MGDGIPYLDIVFFAMVAGFILLRLRAVLGRRTGTEKPPQPIVAPPRDDKVAPLPDRERPRDAATVNQPVLPGVAAVQRVDPGFTPDGFLEGARAAYEMIVAAFAGGDTQALRPLLSDAV